MDSRRSLDGNALALMLVLCTIWSLQQISLKSIAADVAPTMMIALRSGGAALLVAFMMALQGDRVRLASGRWRPGLLVAALFALEFLLLGESLRYTYASHVIVFLYTAPIFAALGLHWRFPAERLRPLQWGGVLVAFAGIGVAFLGGGRPVSATGPAATLLGDLLALLAGAAWGATTVAVRSSSLSNAPATETLLYQLVGAFVLLTLSAFVLGHGQIRATAAFWAHLTFHTVVVSFASFLTWFWLLRRYLASRLGVLTFLTPVLGVLFGAWLLDERLERSFLLGSSMVLAGVLIVSGQAWLVQLWRGLVPQGSRRQGAGAPLDPAGRIDRNRGKR